ncbi:unnamed protein product [Adineta steineri]|uniref:Uncharacterized protein n=1 Tax=Adineta steineri TaxID=433720 RepID=A0A815SVA1_9BILA|nr:unnamed protein product [Adineta steineri]CAF1497924.1 unnamed protein product [Adineta steineri]
MAGNNRRRAPSDYISLSANAAAHVDAYFEYRAFSEHKIDFTEIPTERPILISCRCVSFEYVANASATSDPNCRCKHSLDTYGTRPLYTCQKKQLVHSTGYATSYKAMGGLTGFSSLAEGYLRLDPSGRGQPDGDFLNQSITAMDHPILRAHVFLDPNDYYERRHQERQRLSRGIRAARNPYDTNAQLTTGIRNNKSSPRRITGGKK